MGAGRMRRSFRQSMAWLHTWSGLVIGWLMYAVFVTGTASYYKAEISHWMRPEIRVQAPVDPGSAAELAVAAFRLHAPEAKQWFVRLPNASDSTIGLQWRGKGGTRESLILDSTTGIPVPVRETLGGEFLYRFHYELHMPPLWGRWIVGSATTILIVALISGVVTHRRILADFFTFRPRKGGRRAWLDAHNVFGVLALPYHLVIAYSGLVLLSLTMMPWGVVAAYRGDVPRFAVDLGLTAMQARPATDRPAELAPIAPMIAAARQRSSSKPEHLVIDKPRDANATVTILMEQPRGLAHRHPQIAFDGVSGAVLAESAHPQPAAQTYFVLNGLHTADFAAPLLRSLYTLCGFMGAAMIASGLILWTNARAPSRDRGPSRTVQIVRHLNIGVIVGLPFAIAAFFVANRLLPLDLADRATSEVRIFFGAWILLLLLSVVLQSGPAWRTAIYVTGLLYLMIPVVDFFAVSRTEHIIYGFGGPMAAIGLACFCVGYKVRRN